jgi:alpha-1,3-glucan synthase
MGGHESTGDHYGDGGYGEEQRPEDKPLTKLQRIMQRSLAGWPLYTIIISLGQLLCAVSLHHSLIEVGDCLDLSPMLSTFRLPSN